MDTLAITIKEARRKKKEKSRGEEEENFLHPHQISTAHLLSFLGCFFFLLFLLLRFQLYQKATSLCVSSFYFPSPSGFLLPCHPLQPFGLYWAAISSRSSIMHGSSPSSWKCRSCGIVSSAADGRE